MVRYTIKGDDELAEFAKKYIPSDCTVRIPDKKESPLLDPKDGETGVYAIFFVQAGFTLPLDPLLYRFMWDTGLSLGQISPNAMRVILGCSALNKKLKVKLTPREIFYCYQFCKCPGEDNHGLYLRARAKMPDLVKCLVNSEKDFQKDILCIGGNWKGLDADGKTRVGIHTFINRNHANPKQTPCHEVDFGSINKVLKYNGEFYRVQSRHLRAAHNLLGYTPFDTNWLPERGNQPSELGPVAKKSSKGKGKRKAQSFAKVRTTSEPFTAERVALGPPGVVTATGGFDLESEVGGVTLAQGRNKGTVVEISPDVSGEEDSEKTNSEQEVEDWVEEAFQVIKGMPIQKKALWDDDSPATNSEAQEQLVVQEQSLVVREKTPSPPTRKSRKRKRNTTGLRDEPCTPPHGMGSPGFTEKSPQVLQNQRVEDLTISDHQSLEWRPVLEHLGRPMLMSDSPFQSPSVAVDIIAGLVRAEDVERESKKSNRQLRDETLQGLYVSTLRAAILDNRRLEQVSKCGDLVKSKEDTMKGLEGQLSDKKKECNDLIIAKQGLEKQLETKQGLEKQLEDLKTKYDQDMAAKDKAFSDMAARYSKDLVDLKGKHTSEVEAAEQRGYDIGYVELKAQLEIVKNVCYQVGYNLGLNTMGASEESEHRHPVSLPDGFKIKDHLPAPPPPPALSSEAPPSDVVNAEVSPLTNQDQALQASENQAPPSV